MTFLSRTPLDCAVHPQLWFREDAASIHNITEVVRIGGNKKKKLATLYRS